MNQIDKSKTGKSSKAKPMNRLRYYVALSLLQTALGIAFAGMGLERANAKLSKFALRFGGVDEEAAKRERDAEWEKKHAEIEATPPDKYTVDLTAWKGDDGDPVVELLEVTPEQYAALQHTAAAKRLTVESLLSESVRKGVGV